MMMNRRAVCAALAAAWAGAGCGGGSDEQWVVEMLTGKSAFQGINGMAFDATGKLYAGTVMGQGLFEVNTTSGAATRLVGPATEAGVVSGMADDIAIAANGDIFWSSLLLGQLQVRRANGSLATLNSTLPGINSLAFHPDGRLYVSQCFLADALWRVDPATGAATRVAENLDIAPPGLGPAGLNGFQFGADGRLYGPLWNKGEVVSINVDTTPPTVTTVATGFQTPGAVNLDSRGNIWVIDVARGELVRIDATTRAKAVVAGAPSLRKGLDNLAIDAQDRVYVSNPSDNSIQVYENYTAATGLGGSVRTLITAPLSTAAGLAMGTGGGAETLYVADFFALKSIDPSSGLVTELLRPVADVMPYPSSITANANNLVLSSWFAGTVQVLDRSTRGIRFLQNGFVTPHDAVQQADGSIVVAELALGRLTKVSADGSTRSTLASGLVTPTGLAYDGTNYYVTELAAGTVSRVNASTGAKTTVATGLTGPEGIALGSGGALIVADVGKQRIVSIDPASGAITEIASSLRIGARSLGGPPSYIPTGVAVGGNGIIYFTSDLDSAVYRIVRR